MRVSFAGCFAIVCVTASLISAQSDITGRARAAQQAQQAQQPPAATPQQAQPPANRPATPNAAAPAQAGQAQPAPAQPAQPAAPAPAPLVDNGAFLVPSASLTEMIDILAKRLKINYILDPRVKGTVTIYTYGEVKPVELMQLLQTILRVNGATMVQVGDFYRIIPIALVPQMPLDPQVNPDAKTLPDDERMVLNLIFLKYATATELDKLITPFLGEGAAHSVYEPANLMIIQDNSRSMQRTMKLISMFDSDTFAGQRVRLFDIENSRASDLVKDLDTVFKAYALSDKQGAVRFIPIDRINTIIAVAPNPGVFTEVESWIKKLDIPVKITAGAVNNYVYRLKYGKAETVAAAIMALYTGNTQALIGMAAQANAGMVASGMGYGAVGMSPGFGGLGGGSPYAGGAGYPGGGGAYGYGPGYGAGYGNPYAYGQANGAGPLPAGATGAQTAAGAGAPNGPVSPAGALTGAAATNDLTGSYLGSGGAGAGGFYRIPHVIPNPFDNTLLIQGSAQEYEQITNLLHQLDVPPRQVLIDAKIYEVDLTGAFAAGVSSYLQSRDAAAPAGLGRTLSASATSAGVTLTTGALVLKSHQLLEFLNASETQTRSRVVAAPSIIATDSIPATMNVGDQVPVLTSQAVTGVQQGGNSLFANTISTQSSGTTLSILARVNSSGVVTMVINQQVSAPEAAPPGVSNASTSFSNRSIATQVTVEDGQTVAISGIITEKRTDSSGGVPFLHRIPVLGFAFGAKNYSVGRTELIVFLTPRVIYDTSQIVDATEELQGNLKRVQKLMREH